MSVADILREAADASGVASADVADGGTAYLVGDTIVAVASADGSSAEFRLDPAVAAAAQRTPDTSVSGRGPDWVRFSPIELDDHAIDRAVAWLGSAARRGREA